MSNLFLKDILKKYEYKRFLAQKNLDSRKKDLYSQNKRLEEIDSELANSAISTAKLVLSSNGTSLSDFFTKKKALEKEKLSILKSLGKSPSYLTPFFDCKDCNDTGYLDVHNIDNFQRNSLCNCLKQELFNVEFNKYNMNNLSKENFDNFNIKFYSEKVNSEKYDSGISPRENMKSIKSVVENFVVNFDNPEEKNLLFRGDSGLGKTFLCNCIANELIKMKKTVLYQTAPILLDEIIAYRLNKPDANPNILKNILNADLLIIDDLGTESTNSMKSTELFNIINSRLLNQNNRTSKTIISTNFTLNNIYSVYAERIGSRIIANYNILKFFGDDIRLKKI